MLSPTVPLRGDPIVETAELDDVGEETTTADDESEFESGWESSPVGPLGVFPGVPLS